MSLPRLAFMAAVVAAAPAVAAADDQGPIASGVRPPAEAAARATLARWQAAQNTADFDGYAALYAPAFQGIKRVGKTTKKMNRAAWLKDRKAMFKAPMTVGTADIKVVIPPTGAATGPVLELTQTWASGAFADTGTKRITFSADGQTILAEEMVSSRVVLTKGACLGALFPGASLKQMRTGEDDGTRVVNQIDVLDLGGRWACKVEVERDEGGGVDVTIGVLAFGKKWAARITTELGHDVERDPQNAIEVGGDVALAVLPLHDKVPVIQVTQSTRRDGPGSSESQSETKLYRADGDELVELVSYASSSSGGETDVATSCELAIASRRTRGWPDLVVSCTETRHYWHGEDPPVEETSTETRYRWDGTGYAVR